MEPFVTQNQAAGMSIAKAVAVWTSLDGRDCGFLGSPTLRTGRGYDIQNMPPG